MDSNQINAFDNEKKEIYKTVITEIISGISSKVKKNYEAIDLHKVPDHVNYSKVEKYLRSVNIEITRKMFFSYLKENLLPGGHEVKNANYSYYTREQIIYYILVDMFKPILPLNKVQRFFNEILKPIIIDIGLESTYQTLCETISYMVSKFEEAVTTAIKEENLRIKEIEVKIPEETDDEELKAKYHIAHYTNLVTLCMAKGALDFYKHSPNTLLE